MGKTNFNDDFKQDAVAQINERGYPISEVSERMGVSRHSLCAWKKRFLGQQAMCIRYRRERLRAKETSCEIRSKRRGKVILIKVRFSGHGHQSRKAMNQIARLFINKKTD